MAEEGQVVGCHSVESWKEQFQHGIESKKLVFYFIFGILHFDF